jgi:hypothetical protein
MRQLHFHLRRHRVWRRLLWIAAGSAMALVVQAAAAQTWQQQVDYEKLRSRLGASVPTGAGVAISQVEVGMDNAYTVDASLPPFNGSLDPNGTPVTFLYPGIASTGISSHAGAVGTRFYGDTESLARGANTVTVYEANDWLSNVVRYASNGEPVAQNFRVQNHAWVGTFAAGNPPPEPYVPDANNVMALLRFDYLIDRANGGDGMTAVVGLNNNTAPLPYLLAYSYNAIAVGRSDGIHSSGLTQNPAANGYGPGRSKPEIVVPLTTVSLATGAVSSATTMLYESAAGTDAMKAETMKSVLLAGATKNEFPGWTRTTTQPLDDTFGAGEMNVYNSYLIQHGGKFAGSQSAPESAVGAYGWDYENFKGDSTVGDLYYNFSIPAGSHAEELSIVLTWNAEVVDTSAGVQFTPSLSLQDMNLEFYNSTGSFLGTLMDQSISPVDNVEHLYFTDLEAGAYTLKVSGAADWDFGLAWRTLTALDQPSADFDQNGAVDGADFQAWQQNEGMLLGATSGQGDADGDGDVDVDDLTLWKQRVIAMPGPGMSAQAAAVPEPAGGLLAAIVASGLGAMDLARRRTAA